MKTLPLLCIASVLSPAVALAQNDIAKFFPAGKDNAEILVGNYIEPLTKDLGTLFNNGWYTTAKTHNRFGFDLTVTLNNVLVKKDEKYFDVPQGLTGLSFVGTTQNSSKIPTAYGPQGDIPIFEKTSEGTVFEGPDGFEPGKDYPISASVLPTLQLGVGLFKNTDLRVRYTPKTTINDVKAGNWGVGVMHDIKQHIPGIQELPFSWSFFAGYTQMDGSVDLSGEFAGSGQKGEMNGKGITLQTIISKNFKIVTFYGSIGYQQSSIEYKVKGTYEVGSPGGESEVILRQPFTLTDPYDYKYTQQGIRGTAGIQFKFGPVILNSDFTLAHAQKLLTAGFGFTVN
jgi:hypothetical protein